MDTALARIRAAAERLKPHIRHTPTVYSHTFSESCGSEVWLKLESLQRTGSFKLRGALNRIQLLSPAERARGLVAASAGNPAQGVALAAKLLECQATIVMPLSTPINKVQRTESYGARVVLQGESYDKSQQHAQELVEREGFTLVHPFDDPDVIDGQGTIGLEVLQDLPQVDTIVVSIGGGGLISGIARAVKALKPSVRIIGVQAAGAAPTVASFRARRPVAVERPETIADGIRVGSTGIHTLPTILELVDDCVTVEDHEIADAVVQTMEKSKLVGEAAGVAGIAALLAGKVPQAGTVCAILCGGNIDLNLLARIIENGLSHAGRYHLLRLRLPDTPGQLSRVLGILGEAQCNVLDVQHQRAGWKVPIGSVDVEVLVETRRADHGVEVEARLQNAGFVVRS